MLRSKPGHRRQSLSTDTTTQTEKRTRRRSSLLQTVSADVGNVHQNKQQELPSMESSATMVGSDGESSSPFAFPSNNLDDFGRQSTQKEDSLSNLASSMSALKLIPPSVRFGRGRGRKGLSDR